MSDSSVGTLGPPGVLPASCGVPDPGAPTSIKDPGELSEDAWVRINEAMEGGSMTLPSGRLVVLQSKELVDLIKWVATLKGRRPKAVSKIEDFLPKVTKR